MKRIVKELIFFIWDMLQFIGPLHYLFFVQKFRKELKSSGDKKKLFIVGNGPSAIDAFEKAKEQRSNVHLCTVNFAISNNVFFDLKPELHFFADPFFLSHVEDDKVKKILDTIKKINWNMSILIPYSANNDFYKLLKANKNISVFRFSSQLWETKGLIAKKIKMKLWNQGWLAPRLQNVIVACIFYAIHLGYTNMELYGVEHSWLNDISVNEKNQVCLIDRHFYGEKKIPWEKNDKDIFKMHEILNTLSFTFKAYWDLNEFAMKKNVHIKNMTKNSFIDAFDRG